MTDNNNVLLHYNYGAATKTVTPDEVEWHEQNGWTRADRIGAWQLEPRRTPRHRPTTGSVPIQSPNGSTN